MTPLGPGSHRIPAEVPLLPLVGSVVFPLTLHPLAADRAPAIDAVNRALGADRMVLLLLQTNEAEEPGPDDFRKVGTVGIIRQMAKAPAGVHIILEGLVRVRVDTVRRVGASLTAAVTPSPEQVERSIEIDAYVRSLR